MNSKGATAYSQALALESIGEIGIYDETSEIFNNVTHADLEHYAKVVAFKVAHNLSNGYTMDSSIDPLNYFDCNKANITIDNTDEV